MRTGRDRPAARDDRGISSIEFAILGPVLLWLIWFVVQATLYFYGRSVALQSAREAVSQLRLAQDVGQFDTIDKTVPATTKQFAAHVGSGVLDNVQVTSAADWARNQVTVTVQGTTISLFPGLTLNVSESASGAIETFQVAPG